MCDKFGPILDSLVHMDPNGSYVLNSFEPQPSQARLFTLSQSQAIPAKLKLKSIKPTPELNKQNSNRITSFTIKKHTKASKKRSLDPRKLSQAWRKSYSIYQNTDARTHRANC